MILVGGHVVVLFPVVVRLGYYDVYLSLGKKITGVIRGAGLMPFGVLCGVKTISQLCERTCVFFCLTSRRCVFCFDPIKDGEHYYP